MNPSGGSGFKMPSGGSGNKMPSGSGAPSSGAQDKLQNANRQKSGESLARAEANKPNLGSRLPEKSSNIDAGNQTPNNQGQVGNGNSNSALDQKRKQARANADQKMQNIKRMIEEEALKKLGAAYGIPEPVTDKLIKSKKGQKLLDMIDKKQNMNPLKNKGPLSKLSGDKKKDKDLKDTEKGKDTEKSDGQQVMEGALKISLKVLRMALFCGPLTSLILLFAVVVVAAINDDKVSSMILAGASADEAQQLKENVGTGTKTSFTTGKGNKYPEEYYERLANLGNNYSSQKKCQGKECMSTPEFMYYLKIADIKTRYEQKYNVSLDWYLISATNLYKAESTEETMKANLGGYDRDSVDDINKASGLDWENDYKNIDGYVYLDRDDSTYDLQILAKNMVTKKTVQKCLNSSGAVTKQQEDEDVEDVYLKGDKKLSCASGESYIINSTYEKDENKFKEFMLEYIDLKMYNKGSGNKGKHHSSCSVTTDGSYLWPIGSVETTTGKDSKTYALGEPEYGRANISRGYSNGHQGLDIFSNNRINVVNIIAAKSGTVVYPTSTSQTGFPDVGNSSDGGGYGNYVKIQHEDGSYTLYGHMAQNSITVKAGDKVGAGQVIGKMGHSGDSTGAHLHFEVRSSSDARLDPLKFVSPENPRPGTVEKCDSGGNSLADSMVKLAVSQLDDKSAANGEKYWRWFGSNSRFEWCAAFVSWVVANTENDGQKLSTIIDYKSARVGMWINYLYKTDGLNYVHNDNCSRLADKNGSDKKYVPRPGDLIFFDWDGNWQAKLPTEMRQADHIGIVQRVENGKIITIEGNSNNKVAERSYNLNSCEVIGFGTWY